MADVVLADQTRTLMFDVFAFEELELRSEKHLGWFLSEIYAGRCGPAVASWLLWAGLQHETPRPTNADVRVLLLKHLNAGGTTFDLLWPIAKAIEESELYRSRAKPGKPTPEATPPSATSGSGTGSTDTSQSSTGATT